MEPKPGREASRRNLDVLGPCSQLVGRLSVPDPVGEGHLEVDATSPGTGATGSRPRESVTAVDDV